MVNRNVEKRTFILSSDSDDSEHESEASKDHRGTGPPSPSLGAPGDIYIDVETSILYGYGINGWTQWPGPVKRSTAMAHPVHESMFLWCNSSDTRVSWMPRSKMRRNTASAFDIVSGITAAEPRPKLKRKAEAISVAEDPVGSNKRQNIAEALLPNPDPSALAWQRCKIDDPLSNLTTSLPLDRNQLPPELISVPTFPHSLLTTPKSMPVSQAVIGVPSMQQAAVVVNFIHTTLQVPQIATAPQHSEDPAPSELPSLNSLQSTRISPQPMVDTGPHPSPGVAVSANPLPPPRPPLTSPSPTGSTPGATISINPLPPPPPSTSPSPLLSRISSLEAVNHMLTARNTSLTDLTRQLASQQIAAKREREALQAERTTLLQEREKLLREQQVWVADAQKWFDTSKFLHSRIEEQQSSLRAMETTIRDLRWENEKLKIQMAKDSGLTGPGVNIRINGNMGHPGAKLHTQGINPTPINEIIVIPRPSAPTSDASREPPVHHGRSPSELTTITAAGVVYPPPTPEHQSKYVEPSPSRVGHFVIAGTELPDTQLVELIQQRGGAENVTPSMWGQILLHLELLAQAEHPNFHVPRAGWSDTCAALKNHYLRNIVGSDAPGRPPGPSRVASDSDLNPTAIQSRTPPRAKASFQPASSDMPESIPQAFGSQPDAPAHGARTLDQHATSPAGSRAAGSSQNVLHEPEVASASPKITEPTARASSSSSPVLAPAAHILDAAAVPNGAEREKNVDTSMPVTVVSETLDVEDVTAPSPPPDGPLPIEDQDVVEDPIVQSAPSPVLETEVEDNMNGQPAIRPRRLTQKHLDILWTKYEGAFFCDPCGAMDVKLEVGENPTTIEELLEHSEQQHPQVCDLILARTAGMSDAEIDEWVKAYEDD
ncbi:hypothetical protein C8R46DRAFT_105545 [Mycena filopes]|nr:hypothetical protein C8R46DRAFT_105545 [Mycena filopes]